MPFFPEVDEAKTKENARRILRGYKRWKRVAGNVSQNITATYSFEPRQPYRTPSRPVERLAINKVDAETEIEAIETAVTQLFETEYRIVLIERYMKTHTTPSFLVAEKLGYEKTRYNEILNAALLAFAELYRNGEQVVEKSGIIAN